MGWGMLGQAKGQQERRGGEVVGERINLPLCDRRADEERRVDPKGSNDRGDTDRHEDDQSH